MVARGRGTRQRSCPWQASPSSACSSAPAPYRARSRARSAASSRGTGSVQMPRDQHLDQRLPRDSQPRSLAIQRLHHPEGEIHVDPLLLVPGTPGLRKIQVRGYVLARMELLVKVPRPHGCPLRFSRQLHRHDPCAALPRCNHRQTARIPGLVDHDRLRVPQAAGPRPSRVPSRTPLPGAEPLCQTCSDESSAVRGEPARTALEEDSGARAREGTAPGWNG